MVVDPGNGNLDHADGWETIPFWSRTFAEF